jgi:hypothetical protein
MKKIAFLILTLFMVIPSASSLADGKFYSYGLGLEKVPPRIPYQRALLLFDGNRETLIVQSKYELPEHTAPGKFGWVVPVPSVPELASMDPERADVLFYFLGSRSAANTTEISTILLVASLAFVLVASPLALLLCLLSFFIPGMRFFRRHRAKIAFWAFLALLVWAIPISVPNYLEAQSSKGVDVIRAQTVGVYDVQIIRSSRSDELIRWLNLNQFSFHDSDKQVFDDYLRSGWCFVVAKINPSAAGSHTPNIAYEGLAAPLIMRFPAKNPIYPLALTSTAGQDTQVLLYVASQRKMKTDGRLKLLYAGERDSGVPSTARQGLDPKDFFSQEDLRLPFLCKFKGTLTSEQMKTDLNLVEAEDNTPYRKREIRW